MEIVFYAGYVVNLERKKHKMLQGYKAYSWRDGQQVKAHRSILGVYLSRDLVGIISHNWREVAYHLMMDWGFGSSLGSFGSFCLLRDLVEDNFLQLEGGGLPSYDGLRLWKLLGVLRLHGFRVILFIFCLVSCSGFPLCFFAGQYYTHVLLSFLINATVSRKRKKVILNSWSKRSGPI